MAEQPSGGIDNISALLSSVGNLANLFTSSKQKQVSSGRTVTQGLDISQEGVDAMIRDILESNQGLAATSSGQKTAGLYNSTVNNQLVNDLVSRASGEVAKATAKQTTTTTPETVTTTTPARVNAGNAALGLGATVIGNKVLKSSGILDKISGGIDAIFGGGSAAVEAASSAATVPSLGSLGDALGVSFGDIAGVSDFADTGSSFLDGLGGSGLTDLTGGFPVFSIGSDLVGGDVGGAAATALGYAVGGPIGGTIASILPEGVTSEIFDVGNMLIGGISDLFGGISVVCTELHSQGIMSRELYRSDTAFAKAHMAAGTLRGYRLWGVPLVRLMRKSPKVTAIAAWFAISRAHYIASLSGVSYCPKLARRGKIINTVGVPICNFLGKFVPAKKDYSRYLSLYSL
jgi:hypothetical protein